MQSQLDSSRKRVFVSKVFQSTMVYTTHWYDRRSPDFNCDCDFKKKSRSLHLVTHLARFRFAIRSIPNNHHKQSRMSLLVTLFLIAHGKSVKSIPSTR